MYGHFFGEESSRRAPGELFFLRLTLANLVVQSEMGPPHEPNGACSASSLLFSLSPHRLGRDRHGTVEPQMLVPFKRPEHGGGGDAHAYGVSD